MIWLNLGCCHTPVLKLHWRTFAINHFCVLRRIRPTYSIPPVGAVLCRLSSLALCSINWRQLFFDGLSPADFRYSPFPFSTWCPEYRFFCDVTPVFSQYVLNPVPFSFSKFGLKTLQQPPVSLKYPDKRKNQTTLLAFHYPHLPLPP